MLYRNPWAHKTLLFLAAHFHVLKKQVSLQPTKSFPQHEFIIDYYFPSKKNQPCTKIVNVISLERALVGKVTLVAVTRSTAMWCYSATSSTDIIYLQPIVQLESCLYFLDIRCYNQLLYNNQSLYYLKDFVSLLKWEIISLLKMRDYFLIKNERLFPY